MLLEGWEEEKLRICRELFTLFIAKQVDAAQLSGKPWFPYNRPDRTKQSTCDPDDFMETAEENLGTRNAPEKFRDFRETGPEHQLAFPVLGLDYDCMQFISVIQLI